MEKNQTPPRRMVRGFNANYLPSVLFQKHQIIKVEEKMIFTTSILRPPMERLFEGYRVVVERMSSLIDWSNKNRLD